MCGYLHACVCRYGCVCMCVLICIFLLPRLERDHVILSISASPPRLQPSPSTLGPNWCSGSQAWPLGHTSRISERLGYLHPPRSPQLSLQVTSGWLCLPLFSLFVPLLPSSVAALYSYRDAVTGPRALPWDQSSVKGSSTVLVSYCCSNKLPHLVT